MREAQPIEVVLGTGRREAAVLAAVWLLAIGLVIAWLVAHVDWPVVLRFSVGLALVFGCVVAWYKCRPTCGRLAWDGEQWRWRGAGGDEVAMATGLRIAIDGGGWVLLRDDVGCWCVLARRETGALWHGLRLALHAGRASGRGGATR